MERTIDVRLAMGAVALGSLGSGLFGYAIARARARRQYAVRLDKAIAEAKEYYSRPIVPKSNEGVVLVPNRTKWSDVIKDTLEVKSVRPGVGGLGRSVLGQPGEPDSDGGDEGGGIVGSGIHQVPGSDDSAHSVDLEDEPDGPFEISQEAFGELADEGFQTISIIYYAADKVLVDDRDDPIRDIVGTVGTLNPLGFGGMSGDPHIRYVRNRRLEVDFEILLDARSYTATVLGYGQPGKQREASPAATAS